MVDGKADTVDSIDAGAFIIVLQLELGWFTPKVSNFRIAEMKEPGHTLNIMSHLN